MNISDLRKKLDSKEISAQEIFDEYFKKAEEENKKINCFININKEYSKKRLSKENNSILSNIPGVIKDNISIKDTITTAGSRMLEKYKSPYTASVVLNLKDFMLIGKGNMDSFAFGSSTENSGFGVTKNPLDLTRVAGGSSGGVSAAIASKLALFGIGTDTGGSVRQPASFCGVVGLKPTYGLCSRFGLIAMGSSFDVPGIITQNVKDAAIVLNEIAGYDVNDSTSVNIGKKDYTGLKKINKCKVGILKFPEEGLDKEVLEGFSSSVNLLKSMGMDIVEIDMKYIKYSLSVYYVIVPSEISANMSRYDGIRFGYHPEESFSVLDDFYKESRDKFEDEVKRRIMIGTFTLSQGYYDAYYNKAMKVRNLIKQEFIDTFKDIDFLVSPTTPTLPFHIGEKTKSPLSMYLSDIFTVPANVVGYPAISIPDKKFGDLFSGLQIIAKPFEEERLLSFANMMEEKLWK
jgi:aspartyl-tRNA(Asn)/glutamyl-tRNA(Gln) amidotransferase subunit A